MLEAAKKLLDMGAQNVMISMAGDGAYLVTKDHVYHASAAVGTAVNSVGAGDSMIAGFVGTYYKTHNVVEALKVGSACVVLLHLLKILQLRVKLMLFYHKLQLKK